MFILSRSTDMDLCYKLLIHWIYGIFDTNTL